MTCCEQSRRGPARGDSAHAIALLQRLLTFHRGSVLLLSLCGHPNSRA